MATKISINGKVYQSPSGNITMTNDKIIIDGKDVTPSEKEIYIIVNGDINHLNATHTNEINVIGNVDEIRTSSGDVTVAGGVKQSITTSSGDVKVKRNTGNVKTMSGDVKIKGNTGTINTVSGDIIN